MNRTATEVTVSLNDVQLTLRPLHDRAIRVRANIGNSPEKLNYILNDNLPAPKFDVREQGDELIVATAGLSAILNKSNGSVRFVDSAGKLLLSEKVGGRVVQASKVHDEDCFAVEQTFESPRDEYLFGSGQFQDGYLNIRDLPRRLTQVNTQIALPMFVSSKGYGLLWFNHGLTDWNPADTKVELHADQGVGPSVTVQVTGTEGTKTETRTDKKFIGTFSAPKAGRYAFMLDVGQRMARRHQVSVDGKSIIDQRNFWLPPTTTWLMDLSAGQHTIEIVGEMKDQPFVLMRESRDETRLRSPVAEALDYIVLAGNADQVIAAYRDLTGAVPMMPKWAYGYIHCRERFRSSVEIIDNAVEFRKRNLPIDVIVQDWLYWGKYQWNAMQWDEQYYPDPAKLISDLHEMNIRLMVSVWSKVSMKSQLGPQFAQRGYFLPNSEWVDFFNPDAADFYWKNMREKMLCFGIDAWWQDATEPENDDLQNRKTHVGLGERVRLVFPKLVSKTVYEGLRKDDPQRRAMILTRCAFVGQQKYASATWSGDVGHDFETLRRQIAAGLNYCVTGMPYWTTDAGGFFRPGKGQYIDKAYHEHFLRWFQYSTFSPLLRVHGYQTNTEMWRYGPEVLDISRKFIELRYRLLPYIYSTAWRTTREGYTIMRPLVMDFPDDPTAMERKYEFMFGPSILVSPVTEFVGQESDIYLPMCKQGWYDFWTGEKFAGGTKIRRKVPLDQIPLFIRGGTILPLGPVIQSTAEKSTEPVELRIYPGADASFTLYEDEGTNYNYETGAFATVRLNWDEKSHQLQFAQRQGQFNGMAKSQRFVPVIVKPGVGVGCAVPESSAKGVLYDGSDLRN